MVGAVPKDYAKDMERLDWRRQKGAPQRWITPDGAYVDILPAPPSLIRKGEFTWPDGSARLSLVGFRLAFADAVTLELAPGIHAKVASLPSLVVLKMASYLDRPQERDSDLADIAHILSDFLPSNDERRWSDEVLDRRLEFDEVCPFMVGQRIGSLADGAEVTLVRKFLSTIDDPDDPLATASRMARAASLGPDGLNQVRMRFSAFRRGLESVTRGEEGDRRV